MIHGVSTLLLLVGLQGAPARPSAAAPPIVTGVVQDQTGAVLPGAVVELLTTAGAVVASTTSDNLGTFHFDVVSPGQYQLVARFEGFLPASTRLRITNRPAGAQRLVLGIAGLS